MASEDARRTLQRLASEREIRRAKVNAAIQEEEDPLATFVQFIKWTEENYRGGLLGQSGLITLLEKACRTFTDDSSYKCDLRYFKIWARYAGLVEQPSMVYAYLLDKEIGLVFSQLYDEYAQVLEREKLYDKAKETYQRGIKRRARPIERLRKSYEEFQRRSTTVPRPIPPAPPKPRCKWSPEDEILRTQPLRNILPSIPAPSASSSSITLVSHSVHLPPECTPEVRYRTMMAPPVEGKRPEKMRLNLALLWTKESGEYCIQEARARSNGLLNKKWDPELAPVFRTGVQFNDDGQKTSKQYTTTSRKLAGAEPTVTINTKEALNDVFGMYNSPEKSMRFSNVAGSKHAPFKKIEPMGPLVFTRHESRTTSNENANASTGSKTPAFRPFVDESAKSTTPNVFKTPDPARRALGVKDAAPATKSGDENALAPRSGALFEKVFRPATEDENPAPRNSSTTTVPIPPSSAVFTPFRDANGPARVFSRPTGNEFVPKRSVLDEKTEEAAEEAPRKLLVTRAPLQNAYIPQVHAAVPETQYAFSEDSWDEDEEEEQAVFQEVEDDDNFSALTESEDNYQEQEEFEEYHSREAPLGGRFGQFDVMTPITERTYEFTMSTRALDGTPSSTAERGFVQEEDAHDAAEQLAEELREEGEWDGYQRRSSLQEQAVEEDARVRQYSSFGDDNAPPFRVSDGHTIPIPREGILTPPEPLLPKQLGNLSLSDTLLTVSSFVPPNPCNPFDPAILKTLLVISPHDSSCHDLKEQSAQQLDKLQKFAEKRQRRTSGNSSGNTTRLMDALDVFDLRIADRRFEVTHKLGEGGFGAVFAAKDISARGNDEDDTLDDDEEASLYAIKVVKPRNLWEYHILRRIHCTLLPRLKRSIVQPHALYAFGDESHLILDLCPQGTLLDVVNNAPKMSVSQQGACLDEVLVTFFSIELMRLIEGMHNAGFIHGDLKIDNCLLRLEDVPGGLSAWSIIYQPSGKDGWEYKGIKLIDFGRTIDTQVFPTGQQYIADWPADARDCFEIREDKPWTYQTDYFGLAGIIYCLLFGKYLDKSAIVALDGTPEEERQRYKLSTPFKRYWNTDLWIRLFDLLLNPCYARDDGKMPLCEELSTLRIEMEEWLQKNCDRSSGSLRALLKKIEKFVNS